MGGFNVSPYINRYCHHTTKTIIQWAIRTPTLAVQCRQTTKYQTPQRIVMLHHTLLWQTDHQNITIQPVERHTYIQTSLCILFASKTLSLTVPRASVRHDTIPYLDWARRIPRGLPRPVLPWRQGFDGYYCWRQREQQQTSCWRRRRRSEWQLGWRTWFGYNNIMVLGGDIYYSNDGQIESREVRRFTVDFYLAMNFIRWWRPYLHHKLTKKNSTPTPIFYSYVMVLDGASRHIDAFSNFCVKIGAILITNS